jgi:hypothetical protein
VLTGWLAADRADGIADETGHERVVSELHHRHLPALRDSELVSVMDETATVETTDRPRLGRTVSRRRVRRRSRRRGRPRPAGRPGGRRTEPVTGSFLDRQLGEVAAQRRRITVYTDEPRERLVEHFAD